MWQKWEEAARIKWKIVCQAEPANSVEYDMIRLKGFKMNARREEWSEALCQAFRQHILVWEEGWVSMFVEYTIDPLKIMY